MSVAYLTVFINQSTGRSAVTFHTAENQSNGHFLYVKVKITADVLLNLIKSDNLSMSFCIWALRVANGVAFWFLRKEEGYFSKSEITFSLG